MTKSSLKYNGSLLASFVLGAADSIGVVFGFFAAFTFQQWILSEPDRNWRMSQIILLALSLGAYYALIFTFRREYRQLDNYFTSWPRNRRRIIQRLLLNIALANLIFIAVIFLIKPANFNPGKLAVFGGYILGSLILISFRALVAPRIISLPGKEGIHRLIFPRPLAFSRSTAMELPLSRAKNELLKTGEKIRARLRPARSKTIYINDVDDIQQLLIGADIEQICLNKDRVSPEKAFDLLKILNGKNIRLRIIGSKPKTPAPKPKTELFVNDPR